jgi:hypothetical protein
MRSLRLLVVVMALSVGLLAADSPFSGTWKLNPSTWNAASPAPKSSLAHVDADANIFKVSQEIVGNDDKSQTVGFEAKFDGKDYPVTGDPDTDTVSIHRINTRQITLTYKKAEKVVSKDVAAVSPDGKTTKLTYTDYRQSKPQKGSCIFEKQ